MLLFIESAGFDPANPGPSPNATDPVGGLNQMSSTNLASLGLTRPVWLTLSAAQQLPVIFRFWQGLSKTFAGGVFPSDGPHLLALNFLPASYQTSGAATNPAAVLAGKAGPYASDYASNLWYDPDGTGAITPLTIAKRFALQDQANPARWQILRAGIAAAVGRQNLSPPSVAAGPPPRTTGGGGGAVAVLVAAGLAVWAHVKGWV